MIIDTHTHYDDARYESDRDELLLSLNDNGVELVVEASARLEGCKATIELVNKYDFIYGMLGIHPDEEMDLNDEVYEFIKNNLQNKKIVSIGEIGLDYYGKEKNKDLQKEWFTKFIKLSNEQNMPINVHSRDALCDTLNIISNNKTGEGSGIIHCFSYSIDAARKFVDMGYLLGIGGVVTFKNGKVLKDVVKEIDITKLVLETDCPYLSPEPYRGKRNNSTYIRMVAAAISDIKMMDINDVIKITNENAKRVYRIK